MYASHGSVKPVIGIVLIDLAFYLFNLTSYSVIRLFVATKKLKSSANRKEKARIRADLLN